MNMKFLLLTAAASIALVKTCSAEPQLKSDAPLGLRGFVNSFLESTNKARCRQKCDKRYNATPLSKCEAYCDDVCGSNVRDAGDKCKNPCDFIVCNSDRGFRCFDTSECPSHQYCKFPNGDCDPNHKARYRGQCTDLNKSCSRELRPVCGCDQREYSNVCIAENYGVSVEYTGSCNQSGRTAQDFDGTCRRNSDCQSGYYCKPLFEECSTDDRDGFCTKIPRSKDECRKFANDLVYTCNGKTEKNECRAEFNSQGVSGYDPRGPKGQS